MSRDIIVRIREHLNGDYVKSTEFLLKLAADEIQILLEENAETFILYRKTINECNALEKEVKNLQEQNEYLNTVINTLLREARNEQS